METWAVHVPFTPGTCHRPPPRSKHSLPGLGASPPAVTMQAACPWPLCLLRGHSPAEGRGTTPAFRAQSCCPHLSPLLDRKAGPGELKASPVGPGPWEVAPTRLPRGPVAEWSRVWRSGLMKSWVGPQAQPWPRAAAYLQHAPRDVLLTGVAADAELGVVVGLAVGQPIPAERRRSGRAGPPGSQDATTFTRGLCGSGGPTSSHAKQQCLPGSVPRKVQLGASRAFL